MRGFIRKFSIYLVTTLVSMGIYIAGFIWFDRLLKVWPGYDSLFTGAGLAVVISLLYTPLLGFVRRLVNRLSGYQNYDIPLILHVYSEKISNILELDKLTVAILESIAQVVKFEEGFLFLVDSEIDDAGQKVFRLSGVHGVGVQPGPGGILSSESSPARFFFEKRTLLRQSEIDFSNDFIDARPGILGLSRLAVDVYVPIFVSDVWIGLLALGPKSAGRYTDEDLNLLTMFASKAGPGLENARLVENLKRLNGQVREAYASSDKAIHDLAKLELTKSNFISIASHELRTPLTVARGYVEMLLEDGTLPDDLRELVLGIHKSILRQHEIMDSLFDIVQMDTRLIELQTEDVFVPELIRSVAQELSKPAEERSQEIVLDLPKLPLIKADPDSLRKLFRHLMINAVKFTPNQGRIMVRCAQLPPNSYGLSEGGVEIVVSDTGVGVDKDIQEIIFTKFYQPGELLSRHSTGKTKFRGSGVGLGLALSRGIVQAHGGRIWVESQGYDEKKYPGSDFHVVLPLRLQG